MRRHGLLGLLALASALPLEAQRVVWNDRASPRPADAPTVDVWIPGQRTFALGEPIPVQFRVEDDAYVLVARVDGNGRLTVLYPTRNRSTYVRAGQDVSVRAVRGSSYGAFLASETGGGSGYVFALASYEPFDLSRLSLRDFSPWVTGVNVGQPTTYYIGDPHRTILRFARGVVRYEATPVEYDVEFYTVDWGRGRSRIAMASRFCSPFAAGYRSRGYDLAYDYTFANLGYGSDFDCIDHGYWSRLSCMVNGFALYAVPAMGYCGGYVLGSSQVANNPVRPPLDPAPSDSQKVNGWVPGGVDRPWVTKGTDGPAKPDEFIPVEPRRPPVVADGDDISYAIPSRALRSMRDRRQEGSGPLPERPIPTVAGRGEDAIQWVRPPRAVDRASEPGDFDRLPTRGGARGNDGTRADPIRAFDPPPRSPSFDAGPRGSSGGSSFDRGSDPMPGRSGGGSVGSSSGPTRIDVSPPSPPRSAPPRSAEPPRSEPPKSEPPRTEPPKSEPPRAEPPRA